MIVRDDHGFDVRIDRLRIGGEHIPRLEQAAPAQVRKHNYLYIPDYWNVPGKGPAGNRDEVEEDENADQALPATRPGRISTTLRSLLRNSVPRACSPKVASSVLPITLIHICAVSGLVHGIHNDEEKALSAHTVHRRPPLEGARLVGLHVCGYGHGTRHPRTTSGEFRWKIQRCPSDSSSQPRPRQATLCREE